MKSSDKLPIRFDSAELLKPLGSWLLPEVNGRHIVGFHTKVVQPDVAEITVVDDEIVAEKVTLSELEAIRERAFEEGFKAGEGAGYESGQNAGDIRGYGEGLERGKVEVDQQLLRLEELLRALDQPLHRQHDQIAKLVTDLSVHIAEAVIKQQASEYKSIIQASVTEAIAMLPKQTGELVVTVNPDDVSALASLAEQHKARWRLEPDAKVALGGCVVSTDNSVIDYCVETRFSDVVKQLQDRLQAQQSAMASDTVSDNPISSDKEMGDEPV